MSPSVASMQAFQRVLTEDLQPPAYLTVDEVRGGWVDLYPRLAECLPAPYPIFGSDEERILTYGYPILVSEGIWKLRRDLELHVEQETEYRLSATLDGEGVNKEKVMAQRDRYLRSVSAIVENVFMNDYGRGLLEVFLLFHSGDVVRFLGHVPKLARLRRPDAQRRDVEVARQAIAGIFAGLLQRAAVSAVDRLKKLTEGPSALKMSPLLTVLCQDQLLLTESRPPADLHQLSGYLRSRFRQDAASIINACDHALKKLREVVRRHPEIGSLLATAGAGKLKLDQTKSLLEPRLLDALTAANLITSLELTAPQVRLLREVGLRLKSFELLATLRRRIRPMERRGSELVLAGQSTATAIAPSTRPFDFASPGVVESLVRRCGLVYDLTNFTAVLEEVRKKGRAAEEKALQFMYVFQSRLEEIRQRRVLNFEKFLGDGALYSSRRARRVIAAACEIQRLYDHLRHSGFPFDQGIRIAINFGNYRLLPMLDRAAGGSLRFEFFGHGIVELARLTTGKSTREVEEIAEFLVHAGYDPDHVDHFLEPLMEARGGHHDSGERTYTATIDGRGELINEGIVLTMSYLDELEKELDVTTLVIAELDDMRWAVFPIEPDKTDSPVIGLRHLGVARLKGLSPQELVEATVWDDMPSGARRIPMERPIVDLLRRLDKDEDPESESISDTIPEDLVVVTFLRDTGSREWIFGEYRHSDDVVLHSIQVPIQTPELAPGEPLETWLFRNRFELVRLYDGIRRSTSGLATPLSGMRSRDGYVACFLAAPHRAP